MNQEVPADNKPATEDRSNTGRRFPKKTVGAIGAVAVAALLVGAILLPSTPGTGSWFAPESSDDHHAASATQSIQQLGALDDLAGDTYADVYDQLGSMETQVTTAMDGALAAGTSTIDSALGSADLQGHVTMLAGPAYTVIGPVEPMPLPELPSVPHLDTASVSAWVPMPTDVVPRDPLSGVPLDGAGLPGTGDLGDLGDLGVPEVPGVTDGLGDLGLGELGVPLDDLDALLAGLPVPAPDLGGDDPAATAYNTAQPDQDGAETAQGHATAFLGVASDSLGGGLDAAGSAEASLEGLVGDTQASLASIQQAVAEAQASVPAELQARLAAATQAASEQSAALTAQAEAATALVTDAQATATGHVDATASDLQAQIDAFEDEAIAAIGDASDELYATADARIGSVREQAEAALDQVSGANADAVIETAIQTTASIEAHVEAQAAVFTDLHSEVLAEADALRALVASAQADAHAALAAHAQGALATVTGLAESGQASIEGHLESTLAAHELVATAALDDLSMEAQQRSQAILATATSHAEAIIGLAGTLDGLTDGVIADAGTELAFDLDYILDVAEDYGRVPAPDRQEMADFWSDVHGQLSTGWGLLAQATGQVDAVAADLEAEADATLATLAGLSASI